MKSAAELVAELSGESTRGKRLYEWRDGKGNRVGSPGLAENACAFRMESMRSGRTSEAPTLTGAHAAKPLDLFVTATGEKVVTTLAKSGVGARLEEGFPWFNADGREVRT